MTDKDFSIIYGNVQDCIDMGILVAQSFIILFFWYLYYVRKTLFACSKFCSGNNFLLFSCSS